MPSIPPTPHGSDPILPVRIPKSVWVWSAIAAIIALIEIQFAETSWTIVYGMLDKRFSGILSTANQLPEFLIVISLVVSFWVYRPDARATLVAMGLAVGLSSAVTGIAKDVFGRARPQVGMVIEIDQERVARREKFIAENPDTILTAENADHWLIRSKPEVYWSMDRPWFRGDFASFPSGHATSAFALAVWLTLLFPRLKVFWYLLAVLVCFGRVRFRRHYPGDVIMGAVVGYTVAWLVFSSPWIAAKSAALARWAERRLGCDPAP